MTSGRNPIDPFEIYVEDEVIEDLIERIARTRWPGEITDSGWDYGSNLSYVMDLCDYWKNTFNWREQESRINAFQNFTTNVSGLKIHFILEKGKGPNPLPLV
ncbi:MAG: epoxide hydrolase N-terminal domain-containing protein, partial [Dehalococcoidia bacterium]|nr:epoxide hydrolase N-terminal domain-containing protein [Dehalococcoidia bacterium]